MPGQWRIIFNVSLILLPFLFVRNGLCLLTCFFYTLFLCLFLMNAWHLLPISFFSKIKRITSVNVHNNHTSIHAAVNKGSQCFPSLTMHLLNLFSTIAQYAHLFVLNTFSWQNVLTKTKLKGEKIRVLNISVPPPFATRGRYTYFYSTTLDKYFLHNSSKVLMGFNVPAIIDVFSSLVIKTPVLASTRSLNNSHPDWIHPCCSSSKPR